MISLSGRAAPGLDEFMLRLGHMSLYCDAASEFGGYIRRVEKHVAAQLLREVEVSSGPSPLVEYLKKKKLASLADERGEIKSAEPKYPFLSIKCSDGQDELISLEGSLRVQWQDFALSSPAVRSRVGAISVATKHGSKSGISHVTDWAVMFGIISKNGELAPEGSLISWVRHNLQTERNPYVLGLERIVYAYIMLKIDIDVLLRLIPALRRLPKTFAKSDATACYVGVVDALAQEVAASDQLTSREQFSLIQIWRDIFKGTKTGIRGGSKSTAWHRVSSRLEMLTDIGVLEKGSELAAQKYEYRYTRSTRLDVICEALEGESAQAWIADHLLLFALGVKGDCNVDANEVIPLLGSSVESLGISVGMLPLDVLTLSVACQMAAKGKPVTFRAAREAIEEIALIRSDVMRLARGSKGDNAEFASINLRAL